MTEDNSTGGRSDEEDRRKRDDEFGLSDEGVLEDEERLDDEAVDAGDPEESAPLSDLRADVEQRRETDADDDLAEFFTEMDVGGVDEDTVWEELSAAAETPSVGPETAVPEDDVRETREVTVVEKRLCHGCPHFSNPPKTTCTHEGTTIEAEVDVGHFRVVDCPVVAEREDLEEMETSDF